MDDLIEALQIFNKYLDKNGYKNKYPTNCQHDLLYVCGIRVFDVSDEDKARLAELGFEPGCEEFDEYDGEKCEFVITEESDIWRSHRFGSN